MIEGIFLFDKPPGISSAKFLNRIKQLWKIGRGIRVGHGGTLDPFARGLLVVAIGRTYTKQLGEVLKNTDKEYEVEMVIGAYSDTDDIEGDIKTVGAGDISKEHIRAAVDEVAARTTQTPPAYSAIKVDGEEAYKKARRGENVSLQPRPVSVKEYEMLSVQKEGEYIITRVRLVVSSGFYVRSFVHDVGEVLGVGAYARKLVRTRIGTFYLKDAKKLE